MLNVLCRFRWHTSAPIAAGLVRPTCAFMLAPSMYTWPPCWCTMRHTSLIVSSNTPCVDGYVTISAPRSLACSAALARRSSRSMLPLAAVFTATTWKPAITALAGLVPCADIGMRHTVRWPSPRAIWYARITSRPANSPCEPALGCSETRANPVISASQPSSCANTS